VRKDLLHNSIVGERPVPLSRCEATSTFDPSTYPLCPLTYCTLHSVMMPLLSDCILSSMPLFLNPDFLLWSISCATTAQLEITSNTFLSSFMARLLKLWPRKLSKTSQKKSHDLLHFLITVIIVHKFAHIARSFFHETELMTIKIEDHSYTVELGNSLFTLWFPEAGFQAEQALFGGTIGVVFKDEINGEQPAFFMIKYDRISHFFLQGAHGKTYRLGEWRSPEILHCPHWMDLYNQ